MQSQGGRNPLPGEAALVMVLVSFGLATVGSGAALHGHR